jgi:hypothetical protein
MRASRKTTRLNCCAAGADRRARECCKPWRVAPPGSATRSRRSFAGRALDPAASYLVEELASVAIAVEAIEATRASTSNATTVSDACRSVLGDDPGQDLYREPDIALAIIDAGDDAEALGAARPTIEQLADRGRGRCVPHARKLETGRFYRLGSLVRIPDDPNASEAEEVS